MTIKNLKRLETKLRKRLDRYQDVSVIVGYMNRPRPGEEPYGLKVHEDLEMNHPRGGQAKFLEQPAREIKGTSEASVADMMKTGMSFEEAIKSLAQVIKNKSEVLVPVDTGALQRSAFIEVE